MHVSIRQLAQAAEVHHTTVSRALKNDLRISADTRARIQALAARLGYRPDPMLTALSAYRRGMSRPRYQATLGWLTAYATRDGWRGGEKLSQFNGATARAKELGYHLEEFWLRDPAVTSRKLTQILVARNIQGLLFLAQPRAHAHFNLGWSHFCPITFDHTLTVPRLNVVTNHHFRSMQEIMRQLKKLGYRRIGLAAWPRILESVNRAWTGAFAAFQPDSRQPPIPVFGESWSKKNFRAWFKRHRPEVVITNDPELYGWMEELGLSIPGDVGLVLGAKGVGPANYSGISENPELVGATAVDVVVDLMNRGQRGIPHIPTTTLVEGSWVRGTTVRRMY